MKPEKVKFYVEHSSFGVHAMAILMAMSVVFRAIGCWGLWDDRNYAILQIALPMCSAILLIVCIWLFGKHALWISFIPVVLGAVFFIIESLGFENKIQMILCILLYIAAIALYFCTVFGIIRTKWILVVLFGLAFLYHFFIVDLPALRDTANPVTFAAGMQEMGVLSVLLGLFFLSLSMKKEIKVQEPDLPKMKGPKVLAGKKKAAETVQENTEAQTASVPENEVKPENGQEQNPASDEPAADREQESE